MRNILSKIQFSSTKFSISFFITPIFVKNVLQNSISHICISLIMIAILNYPLFPHETDRFHTVFHIREDGEQFLWSHHLEFHVLDLSQFMVKWKKYRREVKQSPEWPWLTMLSAVDSRTKKIDEEMVRELEGIAMTEQEILEALEEWQNLSVTPENRYAYEMRLKWLLDQLSNIRSSREEGRQEGMQEAIRKMNEKGMSVAEIANILDMTEKDVHELLKG
ncbi:putative transposase/invertase (TIGR01784 family) [Anoxybacillus tepidamans]|uniref:Putative transposase/invertase (TIGR01784 family) n=1 Tax=Anoxybacteroides tepidamans TaxID=265948 RepID=A0A7W8IQG6_9BACL|nr:Rpn family recombination-promoting nuclease/putative transposase [Anoxybacillus tepidamans]MBB5324861.1 putative transposase/invertase (TIGR01784 family) [Anoxybacillus tepidamans]